MNLFCTPRKTANTFFVNQNGFFVLFSVQYKYLLYCLLKTFTRVFDKDSKRRLFIDPLKSGQMYAPKQASLMNHINKLRYSWFAHDVISCHWAPSWLTLQITSAVYSEVLASIYYFIVSFGVL